MKERAIIRYGPFRGYRSSATPENIGPDEAASGSHDFLFHPAESKWVERKGSTMVQNGITEGSLWYRCRKITEMPNVRRMRLSGAASGQPQFEDGYPSYAVLYTAEFPGNAAYSSRDRGYGNVYFYTTNAPAGFHRMGGDVTNTSEYPTTVRTATSFFKCVPQWFSEGEPHRCTDRSLLAAGSRNLAIVDDELYLPNLYATPLRWNLQYNRSGETAGYPLSKERIGLTGMLPPLFPARLMATAPGSETDLNDIDTPTVSAWKEGDRFYLSLCWIRKDGQWGPPYTPRPYTNAPDTNYAINHFGLVTLPSTTASTDYFPYLPLRGIPKAPADCPWKAILRSPKVDSATGAVPEINDLRVMAVIPGDQTSYDAYEGDDAALRVDDDLVRFDQILPPRARHIGVFDGRMLVGFTDRHPAAIVLAPTALDYTAMARPGDPADPTSVAVSNEITHDDDSVLNDVVEGGSAVAAVFGCVVDNTVPYTLRLYRNIIAGAQTTNGIPMTGLTLNKLIDAINATGPTTAAGEWRAQLAPGADGDAVVGDVIGATGVQRFLAAATANQYRDDTCFAALTGVQQAYCQSYPAILYWDRDALRTMFPQPNRQDIWHTSNTPLTANAGVTAAPNYWLARNRRRPPIDSGDFVGMAALTDGTILCYAKMVWLFRNTFAGRTGKDEDYRFDLLSTDGCIAYGSIFQFNGGAGWLSPKGLMIYIEGRGISNISGANYDPDQKTGDWANEIAACIAATQSPQDDPSGTSPTKAARFFCSVMDSELIVRYRSDTSLLNCDRRQRYPFHQAAGMDTLVDRNGSALGWGTPEYKHGTVMGFFRAAGGTTRLEAVEVVNVSTKDGRIDKFDTSDTTDHNIATTPIPAAITTKLVTKMDNLGHERRRHRVRKITTRYRAQSGPFTVLFCRTRDGAEIAHTLLATTANAESMTKRVRTEPTPEALGTPDATGTTTTFVDAALTQADDYWNGYLVRFTSGALNGLEREVLDFEAAPDRVTLTPALPSAPDVTTNYALIKRQNGQAPARVSRVSFTGTRGAVAAEIHGVEKVVEILDTPVDAVT